MKMFFWGLTTFIILLIISIILVNDEHVVLLKDINTNNITNTLKDEDLVNIKAICSYDFCDYIRGETVKSSMEIFIKKYLKKNSNDDEIKKTIYVKGLKITKIIYYD